MVLPLGITLAASPATVNNTDTIKPTTSIEVNRIVLEDDFMPSTDRKYEVKIEKSQYQIQKEATLAKQRQAQLAAQAVKVASTSIQQGDASPEEKEAWVQKAAAKYGIPASLLKAVWQIESGMRWSSSVTSYAGATGPCQFMPSTWRKYAEDGNGDGRADINYAPDCLFGSAKLLASNGAASGNIDKALYAYNHSTSYVNRVKSMAGL